MWHDLFYINNELSLSRVFMAILFCVGILGTLCVYFGLIPNTADVVDLIKWILSLVVGNKVADSAISQIFGSPKGVTLVKNPRGEA